MDPGTSCIPVVTNRAYDGGVAVGGKRDGSALSPTFDRAGANQLTALLRPDAVFDDIDPYRADEGIVIRPAHDSRRAVRRERDGSALSPRFDRAGANQLTALLSPDGAALAENGRGERASLSEGVSSRGSRPKGAEGVSFPQGGLVSRGGQR